MHVDRMRYASSHVLKFIMQVDSEEAKSQEIAKLQSSMEELQKKNDELNDLVVKEREAAKKAIEEAPPVIQEKPVYVEDTEKLESLKAEVDNLKVRHWKISVLCTYRLVDFISFIFLFLDYGFHNNMHVSFSES